MAGTIINGSHLTGIVLNTPATENPATIAATGYITNTTTAYDGDAVFGLAGTPWRVTNLGTVNATGTGSAGVFLSAGGTIINGSSSNTAALVEGYQNGIFINGAGTVTNFGTVAATGSSGIAVSIGGSGVVTNLGQIRDNSAAHSTVFLGSGGRVTNGVSSATTASIDSAFIDINIQGAAGTIINFGQIQDSCTVHSAIYLGAGGTVTNEQSGVITADDDPITFKNGAGTVLNAGTIEGAGAGLYLGSGGIVTNKQTGLITDIARDIFISGTTGTVTNLGRIQDSGTTNSAIYLGAGGTVTNGASGVTTASIKSVFIAIDMHNSAGTVINFGLVENTGTAHSAISLRAGGTITNYAMIESAGLNGVYIETGGEVTNNVGALIKGGPGGRGVFVAGGAGTVTNLGTIESTKNIGVYFGNGGSLTNNAKALIEGGVVGVGIYGAIGTVTNFGTILSTTGRGVYVGGGGMVTNHGLIQTKSTAYASVSFHNTVGAVVNFGTIKSVSDQGAYFQSGGRVTNHGVILNTGTANSAVTVHSKAGTVTNFGTIENTGGFAAVHLSGGGTVANGASGSTAALISGGTGILLDTGGATRMTNFGTITGKIGIAVGTGDIAGNALTDAGTIIGNGGTAVAFGAGNDVLTVDAGAVFKGAVSGGAGTNKLVEGAPGTLTVTGFSGFETIVLADGGSDALTLKSANFSGVTGDTITVEDGDIGNTVSAIGEAAGDRVVVHAGAGLDALTGGPGNDVFYAGGDTTMTGKGGTNEFIFTAPGGNTIEDFAKSANNRLVFSSSGFDLGLGGGTTPKRFTAAEAAALFTANPTGTFADTSQRLAYDTTSHELFSSSDGSGSTPHLVATLADHAAISTSQLFYISGAGGSG